jgi:hypothetical protein
MAEMGPLVVIVAEIVGTAMADHFRHAPQLPHTAGRGAGGYESGDPAHEEAVGNRAWVSQVRLGGNWRNCPDASELLVPEGYYSWPTQ